MLILANKLIVLNFLAVLMRLLKKTEFWELLHYVPQNIFFLETLQVKKLLSYHGNGKRMFGIK